MPTLLQTLNEFRATGASEASIFEAQRKAYGVNKTSDLIPYLNNDVRDIPGILAAKRKDPEAVAANQPLPPAELAKYQAEQKEKAEAAKAAKKAEPTKPTKPDASFKAPGGLGISPLVIPVSPDRRTVKQVKRDTATPGDVLKSIASLGASDKEPEPIPVPRGSTERRGGVDSAARVVGGGSRVIEDVAKGVGHVFGADTEIKPRVDQQRAHIVAEREKRLKMDVSEVVESDVNNLVMALPAMANNLVSSFEAKKGETSLEAGYRAAETIIPGILAGVSEAINHPIDTAKAGPVTAFLTVLPFLSGVSKVAKAGVIKGTSPAKVAAMSDAARAAGAKLVEKAVGKAAADSKWRQYWFDLFDAADPRASQWLENTLQVAPERISSAKRLLPELGEESAAASRAKDLGSAPTAPPPSGPAPTPGTRTSAAKSAEAAFFDDPPTTPPPSYPAPTPEPVVPKVAKRRKVPKKVDRKGIPKAVQSLDQATLDAVHDSATLSRAEVTAKWGAEVEEKAHAVRTAHVEAGTARMRTAHAKEIAALEEKAKTAMRDTPEGPLPAKIPAGASRGGKFRALQDAPEAKPAMRPNPDAGKAPKKAASPEPTGRDIKDILQDKYDTYRPRGPDDSPAVIAYKKKKAAIRKELDDSPHPAKQYEQELFDNTRRLAQLEAEFARRRTPGAKGQNGFGPKAHLEYMLNEARAVKRELAARNASGDPTKAPTPASTLQLKIDKGQGTLARLEEQGKKIKRTDVDARTRHAEMMNDVRRSQDALREQLRTLPKQKATPKKAASPVPEKAPPRDVQLRTKAAATKSIELAKKRHKAELAAKEKELLAEHAVKVAERKKRIADADAAHAPLQAAADAEHAAAKEAAAAGRAARKKWREGDAARRKVEAAERKAKAKAAAEAEARQAELDAAAAAKFAEDEAARLAPVAPPTSAARTAFDEATGVGDTPGQLRMGEVDAAPESVWAEGSRARQAARDAAPELTEGMTEAERLAAVEARAERAKQITLQTGEGQIKDAVKAEQRRLARTFTSEEAGPAKAWMSDLSGKTKLENNARIPRMLERNLPVDVPTEVSGLLNLRTADPFGGRYGDLVTPGRTHVGTVVDALKVLKKENPKKFKTLPKHYQELALMENVDVGGVKVLANPQIAYGVEIFNGVRSAQAYLEKHLGKVAKAGQSLNRVIKEVALPTSPHAMANNLAGNEILTSTWGGRVPFVETGLRGGRLGHAYLDFWKKGIEARKKTPNAKFYEAFERTGTIDSNVMAQDFAKMQQMAEGGKVKGAWKGLVDTGGKVIQVGDGVYKLDIAKTSYDLVQSAFKLMEPGTRVRVRISPRTTATVTKLPNGAFTIETPLTKGRAGKRVYFEGDAALDDVAAQFGALKAKGLYFDYGGDLAGYPRMKRQTPIIGANSPFWTWMYRATDVPGLKPGLGSAVLSGPSGGITSNSAKVNLRLAAKDARTTFGRAMAAAALARSSTDADTVRRAGAYDAGDATQRLVIGTTNPQSIATARFSSANWLEPTMNWMSAVHNGVERLITPTDKLLEEAGKAARTDPKGGTRDPKVLRELVRRAQSRDPLSAGLGAAGLGGSMVIDAFTQAAGGGTNRGFSFVEEAVDALIPSFVQTGAGVIGAKMPTLKKVPGLGYALGAAEDELRKKMFSQLPENIEQQHSMLEYAFSSVIGAGYRMQNTEKEMKRYLRGVKSKLMNQADVRYKQKLFDISEMKGSARLKSDARRRLEMQIDNIKSAITEAVDRAERDYRAGLTKVTKRAVRKMNPKENRRRAAKKRLRTPVKLLNQDRR